MTKSLLSSLKVTARPENGKTNPLVKRREKLLTKLNQQKDMATSLINDEAYTAYREKWVTDTETGERQKKRVAKRVKPWYYQRNNQYFLEIRKGNKALEIQPGMHAIEVGDKENLVSTIETVIEAVIAGELDSLLTPNDKPGKKTSKK